MNPVMSTMRRNITTVAAIMRIQNLKYHSLEDDLEEKGPSADFHPYICHVPDICISMSEYRIHNKWSLPDSGLIAEGDVQSVLNIWRI